MSATLAILGATGYTGRLCAREAVAAGLDVVLAGRDGVKLAQLAGELGAVSPANAVPRTAVVDVDDGSALRQLAEDADVLLTTVGPYQRLGRPALLAALDGGCHYLDVSGEVPFLAWARSHDDRARDAGIALCPGFGFDGFPGDLLAGIAAAALDGPARRARAAYLLRGGLPSAGTARSLVGMLGEPGAAWRDGALAPEAVGAQVWAAPFPEPLGERDALSAPLPDVLTLGPSTGAPEAGAYLVLPAASVLAKASAPAQGVLRAVLGGGRGDKLRRLADRLPDGPEPQQRARARAAVVAEVTGDGGVARAWCRLRDPYLTTARITTAIAARLLADGAPAVGALTPTQFLGADAGDFLQGIGADWAMC